MTVAFRLVRNNRGQYRIQNQWMEGAIVCGFHDYDQQTYESREEAATRMKELSETEVWYPETESNDNRRV